MLLSLLCWHVDRLTPRGDAAPWYRGHVIVFGKNGPVGRHFARPGYQIAGTAQHTAGTVNGSVLGSTAAKGIAAVVCHEVIVQREWRLRTRRRQRH